MLFNSWGYILLFLVTGTALHWTLPHRFRIYLLAFGGILFYCFWKWQFVFLMLFSPTVDFICALKIYEAKTKWERKMWLISALTINIGLLVFFKYTYFLYGSAQFLAGLIGLHLANLTWQIILPLGISFYTFHSISYSIDVYRGAVTPVKKYITFLTYVTFWPQLMAGPILRPKEVLPQLEKHRFFNPDRFAAGIERIIFGYFKKVVIADNIGSLVNTAFGYDPHLLTAYDVWIAAFLFGFQIYFDFAGYSDIAIGSAKLLGVEFPENFSWPYLATSPREFWRRWHISLSSWIRDYLYLPLTGQKFKTHSTGGIGDAATEQRKAIHLNMALFLTWFIMGLWHGAAWTLALWGVYHATLIFLYRQLPPLQKLEKRLPAISWLLTLSLSMFAWIPFRATSLNQTFIMFGKLISPHAYIMGLHKLTLRDYVTTILLMLGMLSLYGIKVQFEKYRQNTVFLALKFLCLAVMVAFIIALMENETQFIYFQF